MTILFSIEW